MFLHLGKDIVINTKYIVGIFDIEKTSVKPDINNFLRECTKNNQVINVSYEMPRAIIVHREKDLEKVYITPVSAGALAKRIETGEKN